ncbi:MAG UNVERIFIED_CONTAM: hypothetical protein LVT10_07510 [Anaerolineae bacterium]
MPTQFVATRYHSLIVEEATFPDSLEANAWAESGRNHWACAMRGIPHSRGTVPPRKHPNPRRGNHSEKLF